MNSIKKTFNGVLIIALVCLFGCGVQQYGHDLKKVVENQSSDKVYIGIAVLGSGPAGCGAAIYAANASIPTVVFEGGMPGGLLTQTTVVENWPGIKAMRGPVIMDGTKEQAQGFGALFVNDIIDSVDFSQWPFVLHTESGNTYYALAVVIATGASPRKLGVEGEQKYWGVGGVNSCAVCHAPLYKGQDVVVIGGGDSAVEEAIQLSSYAKKVTILVRKDAMRASARMQKLLAGYPNISVQYNVEVHKIVGDDTFVTGVELYNTVTKETTVMPTNGIFLAIGHVPNSELFKDYIKIDQDGYIEPVGRSQKTSVPGIFAAGQVTDKVYRQAGVSAGQGSIAGIDASNFLKDLGFNTQVEEAMRPFLFKGDQKKESLVVHINNLADFQEHVANSSLPVIVDFYADYCPSCMQMLPIFQKVSEQFEGQVLFAKVDTEQAADVAEKLYVLRVPTLLVFKDGKIVARYHEVMSIKELTEFVHKFL